MPNLGIAIVRQYERGVVFRLGRLHAVRKPGIHFMIPFGDRMWKISMRTVTMPVPSQQVITQDNVSIGVAAVAYYRRMDAVKSIVEIENVSAAVGQIAQTTVRNIVGRSMLDQVLTDTQTLNLAIREILDRTTQQWGVYVFLVELKDIELPVSMQRAMARQAEAEREKRAKIIAAEGEALSAGRLAEAADVIADHPVALQLRNLQILAEIAAEKNSTIVFPAQLLDSARAVARFVDEESRGRPGGPHGARRADPQAEAGAAREAFETPDRPAALLSADGADDGRSARSAEDTDGAEDAEKAEAAEEIEGWEGEGGATDAPGPGGPTPERGS